MSKRTASRWHADGVGELSAVQLPGNQDATRQRGARRGGARACLAAARRSRSPPDQGIARARALSIEQMIVHATTPRF
jgi:hypothetical protein